MYCPMKFRNDFDFDLWECEEKKCAWWNGDTQRCAIKGISNWLDSIWNLMYQKEKIAGAARE